MPPVTVCDLTQTLIIPAAAIYEFLGGVIIGVVDKIPESISTMFTGLKTSFNLKYGRLYSFVCYGHWWGSFRQSIFNGDRRLSQALAVILAAINKCPNRIIVTDVQIIPCVPTVLPCFNASFDFEGCLLFNCLFLYHRL